MDRAVFMDCVFDVLHADDAINNQSAENVFLLNNQDLFFSSGDSGCKSEELSQINQWQESPPKICDTAHP